MNGAKLASHSAASAATMMVNAKYGSIAKDTMSFWDKAISTTKAAKEADVLKAQDYEKALREAYDRACKNYLDSKAVVAANAETRAAIKKQLEELDPMKDPDYNKIKAQLTRDLANVGSKTTYSIKSGEGSTKVASAVSRKIIGGKDSGDNGMGKNTISSSVKDALVNVKNATAGNTPSLVKNVERGADSKTLADAEKSLSNLKQRKDAAAQSVKDIRNDYDKRITSLMAQKALRLERQLKAKNEELTAIDASSKAELNKNLSDIATKKSSDFKKSAEAVIGGGAAATVGGVAISKAVTDAESNFKKLSKKMDGFDDTQIITTEDIPASDGEEGGTKVTKKEMTDSAKATSFKNKVNFRRTQVLNYIKEFQKAIEKLEAAIDKKEAKATAKAMKKVAKESVDEIDSIDELKLAIYESFHEGEISDAERDLLLAQLE